jgi:hypothetical protein
VLQVFNSSGQVVFDSTSRLFKFFGKVSIGQPGSGNSSVADSRFSLVGEGRGTFVYFLIPTTASGTALFDRPSIGLSGTSVVWTWPTSTRIPFDLVYGIY